MILSAYHKKISSKELNYICLYVVKRVLNIVKEIMLNPDNVKNWKKYLSHGAIILAKVI